MSIDNPNMPVGVQADRHSSFVDAITSADDTNSSAKVNFPLPNGSHHQVSPAIDNKLRVIDSSFSAIGPIGESFTVFPKLPIEMRFKIWRMSLTPRIVEVRVPRNPSQYKYDFIADIPSTLHVCQESRNECKKFYTIAFQGKHSLNKVYFNFDFDVLHFRQLVSTYTMGFYSGFMSRLPQSNELKRISFLFVGWLENGMLRTRWPEMLPYCLTEDMEIEEIFLSHAQVNEGISYHLGLGYIEGPTAEGGKACDNCRDNRTTIMDTEGEPNLSAIDSHYEADHVSTFLEKMHHPRFPSSEPYKRVKFIYKNLCRCKVSDNQDYSKAWGTKIHQTRGKKASDDAKQK